MNVSELNPAPVSQVRFHLTEYRKIPQNAGCYVLTTFDRNILYVGQAVNLNNRFQQHLANPEKTQPTQEGRAFWFYFLEWDTAGIGYLENSWLEEFERVEGRLPILNKVHSPG